MEKEYKPKPEELNFSAQRQDGSATIKDTIKEELTLDKLSIYGDALKDYEKERIATLADLGIVEIGDDGKVIIPDKKDFFDYSFFSLDPNIQYKLGLKYTKEYPKPNQFGKSSIVRIFDNIPVYDKKNLSNGKLYQGVYFHLKITI